MKYFIRLILISIGSLFLIGTLANGQQPVENKRVLILITGEKGVPGYVLAEEGVRASLDSRKDLSFEYFTEHMDRYRFQDASYQKDLLNLYRTKYSNKKFDFIIAYGFHALTLAANHGEELFPQTPIVFSAVMESQVKRLHLDQQFAGSFLKIDYPGLLNTALKNHPDTRHVAIISGASKVGRLIEGQSRKAYKSYLDQYDFIHLGHQAMPDLMDRLAKLPEHTVVIYFYLTLDGKGKAFKPWKVASMISRAANAPVYGLTDTYMGHGIVGGRLLSYKAHGKKAGEIGLRILDGENPADIPVSAEGTIQDMFDWRQLKRWGIKNSTLPQDSIVLYKERSFWDLYQWYIICGICVVFIQAFLIAALLVLRKKARQGEQALKVSDESYKTFLKNSSEDIYCFELEHPLDLTLSEDEQIDHLYKYVYVAVANDSWARAAGYDQGEDLLGMRLKDIIPRSSAESIAIFRKLISMQYNMDNIEILEVYKNEKKRWVSNNVAGILEEGRLVKVWGTGRDITDLKAANEKLRKAEQKYRNLADFTYDWEYWQGADGQMIYVSPSCERISGYSPQEFTADPNLLDDIIIEDSFHRQHRACNINSKVNIGSESLIYRIRRKDGETRWVEHAYTPVYDSEGNSLGIRASNRDVTKRKLAEESLEKSEQQLRLIADSLPVFISYVDRNGHYVFNNKLYLDFYNLTIDQIIGKSTKDILDTKTYKYVRPHIKKALGGEITWFEVEILKSGKQHQIESTYIPDKDQNGHVNGFFVLGTDVTDRKQREVELQRHREELAHVSRLTTMGELTASMAHELNQPLTAILSNAQAARRFLEHDIVEIEEVKEILDDIIGDDRRAGQVINRLRAFLKRDGVNFKTLDINEVIQEVTTLVHSDAVIRNVSVHLDLQENVPYVLGDRVQIQQVLLNLIINGLDAMVDVHQESRNLMIKAEYENNKEVKVSVGDSGAGIQPDQMQLRFEPFHTTKADGMGMGLSINRSIIQTHQGEMWAENNTNKGATFFFTLPIDSRDNIDDQ